MSEMYFHFYQVAMILSLMASLFVMVLMWRRRQSLGARAMIVLVVATFVWTLSFLLEANSNTLERQLFFNNIGYLGSMTVPVAWFIFAVNYANGRRMVTGWKVILLCIIPFITVTLVWSNSWHNLMWSNEHLKISGPFLVTAKTYGPFFWGALTHNYILIVAGVVILVRRLFVGTPLYTRQAVSLMVAVSLPLVWNIIYVFNLVPLPRKDLTPVMFAISGIAIALGLMRFRLFTVIPFARKFVIQQLSDGVFVFDVLNRLLEANPAALKMLGVDKNIVGKGLEDLLPLSPVFKCLSSVKFGRVELPLTVSGKARFYEMETVPMCDNQEQQMGWLATLHDITKRKQAEEELKRNKEYLETLNDSLSEAILTVDIPDNIDDRSVRYVNKAVENIFGYKQKEWLGKSPVAQYASKEDFINLGKILKSAISRGTKVIHRELPLKKKSGETFPAELTITFLRTGGKVRQIISIVRDITERKKMQEQLMTKDRLASIGELVAGVAHELNNPLTGVIGFSGLLASREDLPDEVKGDLETINREARRTANIVKNLLTFARKQPEEKQPTDINKAIAAVLELRAYEQKVSNIQVNTQFAPDLPEIMANSSDLLQVFLNIIVNAENAMLEAHGGGIITITTKQDGDIIRASFADDGPGISKENIGHVFNPFFTTKEVGKGTGLGLSICYGTIIEHGGMIYAESEPGKGATFIIELPVVTTDNEGTANENS